MAIPPKKFFTYEQQIQHLRDQNLIINNEEDAIERLKHHSYYASVSAYKHIFKTERNGKYKEGTTFAHIMTLCLMDQYLRDIFLHEIIVVERKMKSLYGYAFCSLYGDRQQDYLNANNYNYPHFQKQVNEFLVMVQDHLDNPSRDHIRYNLQKYGEVPFWVLIHIFTFGNISKMYGFSLPKLQSAVARNFGPDVYPKQLLSMLQVLSKFRNICAHGERLYSFRTRMAIEDMPIHRSLGIPKKGPLYIYGKNDLFAVMICLKYLLTRHDFDMFIAQFQDVIKIFFLDLPPDIVALVKEDMGLPNNWTQILK